MNGEKRRPQPTPHQLPAKVAAPIVPQRVQNGTQALDTVPDELARLIRGAFVVIVGTTTGTHRRRVFLTLKAAEAAARRATDRGQVAEVVLAELRPVWHITSVIDPAVPK